MSEIAVAGHHGLNSGGPFGVFALALDGANGEMSCAAGISGGGARFHELFVMPAAQSTSFAQGLIPLFVDGYSATADKNYDLAYFGDTTAGSCYFAFRGWSNDWQCYTSQFLAGQWNHVALGYDGNLTMYLFLNGVLLPDGTKTLPRPLNTRATNLRWGSDVYDRHGICKMAAMRVWNTNRTQAQLQANMSLLLPPQTGLLAQYPLLEGSGPTSDDASGNNLTLTLSSSGATWVNQ